MADVAGEREIIFTGIGGQGIQLMAKILAETAVHEGRYAMLFGVYMGMMRGGASESTVVVGDQPIDTPPIIPHCWGVVAMHPQGLDETTAKLRPGGLVFANETLVTRAPLSAAQRAASMSSLMAAPPLGELVTRTIMKRTLRLAPATPAALLPMAAPMPATWVPWPLMSETSPPLASARLFGAL
jgi:Pyruvate/2-oxoacid:ferredoxin oxidoreductase gamma subunit